MIQKGPDQQKGPQMVNVWVDHFDPFWTLSDARKCQSQDTLITLTSWVKGTSPFHIQPSNSALPVGWAEGKSKNLILPRKPLAPWEQSDKKQNSVEQQIRREAIILHGLNIELVCRSASGISIGYVELDIHYDVTIFTLLVAIVHIVQISVEPVARWICRAWYSLCKACLPFNGFAT